LQLRSKWTPEDDERLLMMSAAKKPHVLIGASLRRSTRAVNARLRILRHQLTQPTGDGADEASVNVDR
jgi:hypothetical protein